MTQAAVHLESVVRTFGSLTAIDRVSFGVEHGEIFGLLGHNGAGKTTIIRLATGLLRPDAGRITTLGHDPMIAGEQVRSRTGVLTEYPALDGFLSPRENLAVYATIHGLDARDASRRGDALLERLGLVAQRDVAAHTLSAGLKQRLALARALVHDPELILLDEPTSNLDPVAAREVRDLVAELSRERGRTILISTHNLAEAQQLCDRIAIIRHGSLLATGSVAELRAAVSVGSVEVVVAAGAASAARMALASLDHVAACEVVDDRTVLVRLPADGIPRAVQALVAAGVAVHAVRPEAPTLEDAYVSLHRDGHAVLHEPVREGLAS